MTTKTRMQRGQALVILAAAFVGLAAFIGLTVDAGILFSNIGHLRRATDAAVLAAANQFREGWDPPDLASEAQEMLDLNNIDGGRADVFVCDLSNNPLAPLFPGYHDPALCPGGVYPLNTSFGTPRKVVRVVSYMDVEFAFLPIIGFGSLEISANAESEAASIDIVLALDVSESMALDLCEDDVDNDGDGPKDAADCKGAVGTEPFEDDVQACLDATNSSHYPYPPEPFDIEAVFPNECHPFESVRYSAHRLVDRMYFPYDRLSIVTFGRTPSVELELDDSDDLRVDLGCVATDPKDCAHRVLDSLRVELSPLGTPLCEGSTPRGCMSTNIGGGLRRAGARFCKDDNPANGVCDRAEMREEAVWIVILLTDGAANAAIRDGDDPSDFTKWICPANTYDPAALPPPLGAEKEPPYCRDIDAGTRHPNGDVNHDADDYARDQADNVGCPGPGVALPPGSGCPVDGGVGAVIFTIGLGDNVIDNPEDTIEPRAGELLLRYIADVGIDGEPVPPSPDDPFDCFPDPTVGTDCGNYYFAPQGDDLVDVFEDIASRIFTRITH